MGCLRFGWEYERICVVKRILSRVALAAAILASCASMGAETARPATAADVLAGGLEHELVKVSGIVSSVTWDEMGSGRNWFALRTPSGVVYAMVKESEYPLGRLFKLTDAEVKQYFGETQRLLEGLNILK